MHLGSTFLSRLRMMLLGIWLGLYGYYFLSSIIIFKVQCIKVYSKFSSVQFSSVQFSSVGVWLGLHWVLFYFFDHYIQSSVQFSSVDFTGYYFISSIIMFKVQFSSVQFVRGHSSIFAGLWPGSCEHFIIITIHYINITGGDILQTLYSRR